MPKPKPKAKPAGSQSKTEPQKRGEVFDTLLTFFRRPKRKTLTLELPRALKSYPYIAMKRSGVKAKAQYETVSKAENPLDDVLRFKVTLTKEPKKDHDKTPKQKTVAKSTPEKKPKADGNSSKQLGPSKDGARPASTGEHKLANTRRSKNSVNIVPVMPTKGVDITQLANA